MPQNTNLLLDALPESDRAALEPHLKRVQARQHDIFFDVNDAIANVYFLTDAVVSL